jgi:hypothetical protein
LAGLAASYGRGQFAHLVLVAGACVLVAIPCAVLGGGLTAIGCRRPSAAGVGNFLLALAVLIAVQLISIPAGAYLHWSDVRDARAYRDQLAVALERGHRTAGAYPATLGGLVHPAQPLPHLLRGQAIYVSDGRSFVLSFAERNALVPRVHLYSSDRHAWTAF